MQTTCFWATSSSTGMTISPEVQQTEADGSPRGTAGLGSGLSLARGHVHL